MIGVKHEAEIAAIRERISAIEAADGLQWTAINESRDKFEAALRDYAQRLPNWAVAIVSAGGCAIGVLTTLLVAHL